MPSIDYSSPHHKAYIKSQSILLSIMTIALFFFVVMGFVFDLLVGLSITIITLSWIVVAGWIDIIKTIKDDQRRNKSMKTKFNSAICTTKEELLKS